MLVRQQAQGLVDARKIIAEGAVEIVGEAVTMSGCRDYELDEIDRLYDYVKAQQRSGQIFNRIPQDASPERGFAIR